MGFWDFLDKIVGSIPVVGTIKDSVEAVVLECEGKHEAAKEKAMEAAMDLASDFITVATLGEGYVVATAGKEAAELAFKEALKGEIKAVAKEEAAKAAKIGFSPTASKAIGAAAAAAEAKRAVKEKIANKNGKEYKPISKSHHDDERKDPKRGHHVINNGVRRIFPKIIDRFLHSNAHYFNAQNFTQLSDQGYISQRMTVYSNHEHPFTALDDQFIQTSVAYTPEGEHHDDPNDAAYGVMVYSLQVAVIHYMSKLFEVLVNDETQITRLDHYYTNIAVSISEMVHQIDERDVYVDQQALRWWLNAGGSQSRYNEVHGNVSNMFRQLSHTGGAVAITWVRELFHTYKQLHHI